MRAVLAEVTDNGNRTRRLPMSGLGTAPIDSLPARIWDRDSSVWGPGDDDPAERLGWLDLPETIRGELASVEAFVRDTGAYKDRVVLLGMGGSSLAPEIFASTFGTRPGYPQLTILDSTHPEQIEAVADALVGAETLYVVSSKSGTTIETLALYSFFRARSPDARNFVAITDAGTALQELAEAEGFGGVFLAAPDVGGRYSALSLFGLVPAALCGVDLDALLRHAAAIAAACRPSSRPAQNPGLVVGQAIGRLAAFGRDKLTFLTSPGLALFGDWVEQLIAESTGKRGAGIVPVVGEPLIDRYGSDRMFVHLRLKGDDSLDARVDELQAAGEPVVRLDVAGPEELGALMYLWEFATAVAGSVLGVNAFDQPDVEAAKKAARAALEAAGDPEWAEDDVDDLFADPREGDYAAFLAFAPRTAERREVLDAARAKIARSSGMATTAGFGPRYLHSTGQLHKGGPDTVRALVILDPPDDDIGIPGQPYGFARLLRAQAAGDYEALKAAGKRVARTTWVRFEEWARS
ncbi:MAG TPA: glucose-6-phosphate isomerase [Actinomycetota bacterium]|nr:glucose-6-phosphate isomerase [Actinomycetota bacterium]